MQSFTTHVYSDIKSGSGTNPAHFFKIVYVYFACMYVYHLGVVPRRPEEGVRLLGVGITEAGSCLVGAGN